MKLRIQGRRVTAIKLSTRARHPECNEGSPKVALGQFQEILHCVQDDGLRSG
jgi:hypothetical protein